MRIGYEGGVEVKKGLEPRGDDNFAHVCYMRRSRALRAASKAVDTTERQLVRGTKAGQVSASSCATNANVARRPDYGKRPRFEKDAHTKACLNYTPHVSNSPRSFFVLAIFSVLYSPRLAFLHCLC